MSRGSTRSRTAIPSRVRSCQSLPVDIIGGYRLVRTLGSGSSSEVLLGHPTVRLDGPAVAVKRYRPEVSDDDIARQVAALSKTTSPHLLRLEDIALDRAGRTALILTLLDPVTLARHLERREKLAAGEIVTILAPVIGAAAALHAAGVSHGRIGTASILFDRTGAPVLTSFGRCAPIAAAHGGAAPTEAQLAADGGVSLDLAAIDRLVRDLLTTAPGAGHPLLEWLDHSADDRDSPAAWLGSLESRVFDLAPPVAVEIPAPHAPGRGRIPGRIFSGAPGAEASGSETSGSGTFGSRTSGSRTSGSGTSGSRTFDTRASGGEAGRPPRTSARRAHRDAEPRLKPRTTGASTVVTAVSGLLREAVPEMARRRSFWIAVATGAVLVLGALFLIPGGTAQSDDRASDGSDAAAAGGAGTPGAHPDVDPPVADASRGDAPAGNPRRPGRGSAPTSTSHERADRQATDTVATARLRAVTGNDPAAAASALLAMRIACIHAGGGFCLDAVDQPGSAARMADGAADHGVVPDTATADETTADGTTADTMAGDTMAGDPTAGDPVTTGTMPTAGGGVDDPVVVGHWGGAALLSLDGSAPDATRHSILIVRGEEGWRIRSWRIG